ncbi:MAG: hypothetical protein AB7O24_07780 [Kofleriaceae bacterium]
MRVAVGVVLFLAVGCATDDEDPGASCGDGVCDGSESNSTCPGDCPIGGPRCGDGICNGSETSASCSSDCAAGACSTSQDNCGGETICISGRCEAAFPRVYSIRNVSVSVPTTNPANGSSWDAGGGAPDMFLSSNGTMLTQPVDDQFMASFPGPFDVSLIAGATLQIDVYDEDITVHDGVMTCREMPITAQRLRTRMFGCAGNGMTFTSTIQPK